MVFNNVILYNGSLEEMNSREDTFEYRFVEEKLEFISEAHRIKSEDSTTIEDRVKEELLDLGYD